MVGGLSDPSFTPALGGRAAGPDDGTVDAE
jgi:hypothetical protein